MWQCDMGIVQSNSIHFDMTCRIAEYQDIKWYFWNANNTFKLSICYLFVYLMPCLVKSWHSVDPTQFVVLLLADLQHISADYAYFSLVVYQDTGKGESTKPMPLGATREILHIHTILIRAYPALKKNRVSCPRISIITLWWICSLSTFKCIRPFTVQLKPGHYPRW